MHSCRINQKTARLIYEHWPKTQASTANTERYLANSVSQVLVQKSWRESRLCDVNVNSYRMKRCRLMRLLNMIVWFM